MSKLQDMLRVQARLHKKQGANALGNLFKNASDEIESLRTQLAKANERVAEKQKVIFDRDNYIQELRQENGEYAILIANLVRRADVKTDLLQNPTFEKASVYLNKFAIEKNLKVLDDLLEEIQCSVVVPKRYEQFQEPYLEGIKHCIQFIECQSKQLRKEQE